MQSKYIYPIFLVALLLHSGYLQAQTSNSLGTFTPYSMFGLGDMVRPGSSFNRSMGGIGVALRDNRYINFINPASITARDSLAFMLDFGVESQNLYHKNSLTKSAYNTFNMSHLVFSIPIYKKSAMMVGFVPFSHVGYKFEEKEQRPEYVNEMGNVVYQHYGEGSINQLFVAAALKVSKNFSIGAQWMYYFGALYRSSNVIHNSVASYSSILTNNNLILKSFSGKFGLMYEGLVTNRSVVTAGASVILPSNLTGEVNRIATTVTGSMIDTVYQSSLPNTQMQIPAEFSAGVAWNKRYFTESNLNKWMIGFDFTYQDWTKTTFAATPGVDWITTAKSSYKVGGEWTPDFFDTRYMLKHWTYRGGIYHERSYMRVNGQQIAATGVSLGVSLPVFRYSNMLNVGIDVGQRGSLKDQSVQERYVLFQLSFSLYDRWFRKIKYE